MSGRALVKMPYDAEIEYLESTGTQYINTRIGNAGTGSFIIGPDKTN